MSADEAILYQHDAAEAGVPVIIASAMKLAPGDSGHVCWVYVHGGNRRGGRESRKVE